MCRLITTVVPKKCADKLTSSYYGVNVFEVVGDNNVFSTFIIIKTMEREQHIAELLNSINKSNIHDAASPDEWRSVMRDYFCHATEDHMDSSDDELQEENIADDDFEPETVVVDAAMMCEQRADFVISDAQVKEIQKVQDHK